MPDSDASHIARLEERVEGVREDVYSLMAELQSARKRLHNLEGIAAAFVDAQQVARKHEESQYRRLSVAIAFLAVVVAVAAIIVPLVVVNTLGK